MFLFPFSPLLVLNVTSYGLGYTPVTLDLCPALGLGAVEESLGAVPTLLSDSQTVGAIPVLFWLRVQSTVPYGLLC